MKEVARIRFNVDACTRWPCILLLNYNCSAVELGSICQDHTALDLAIEVLTAATISTTTTATTTTATTSIDDVTTSTFEGFGFDKSSKHPPNPSNP